MTSIVLVYAHTHIHTHTITHKYPLLANGAYNAKEDREREVY